MSDNLNKKVLLVGATQIALDYYKVLQDLGCDITVVGRGQAHVAEFALKTDARPVAGGLEKFLKENSASDFDAFFVTVGVEQLAKIGQLLLRAGAQNVLLEKPGGLDSREINNLAKLAAKQKVRVFVAYNRRFYSSVLKAEEIIKADGGVQSFIFEFTEWAHQIEKIQRYPEVLAHWLLANSSHLIDLAFFLGGHPAAIKCFTGGQLNWHNKSMFSGAGVTVQGTLFSYSANWSAPGRWSVEIMTSSHRLILRPLEELQIQDKGSVVINKVEIDNSLDLNFKPGLYRELRAFLSADYTRFKTIAEQAEAVMIYKQIAKGN